MKLTAIGLGLCLATGFAPVARADDPPAPKTFDLWPEKPPGEAGAIGEEKSETSGGILRISNVTKPTLTVYRPSPEKDTGAAVVICPGGGYSILASDHEGAKVAEWLNTIGVTGVLLKYRVPRREGTPKDAPPPQALMDAQRALSVTRAHAADLGLDPKRIGILGFSAGGHLAAWASTNPDKRAYEPVDDLDKADCRPDFTILVYPAYLTEKDGEGLAPEIRVGSGSPPTFFAHAGDDPVTVESSVRMYLALKRAGVPSELHVYASGGHGFGMNPIGKPVASWPRRCEEWMKARGLLKPGEKG
ncbi:alpha/beta hydrolase [Tundrisphaera lichenicola]|uniref:alpha/beta hydrolase n=1 Tax=Tundrisphaera lichenicola TaxID=2029860 RepID=UPI003EBE60B4